MLCTRSKLIVLLIFYLLHPYTYALQASDSAIVVGVVGKDDQKFFTQAHLGCLKAESELDGIHCIYRSPKFADVVEQDAVINQLIDEGVDGIAVSILQSQYLSKHSLKKAMLHKVPIVTFDSDLDTNTLKENTRIREAYIGTDNASFGRTMAHYLIDAMPKGGVICLLSGRPDTPNMMQRMKGLRATLSGDEKTRAPGKRLKGKNGWVEHRRCPMYNYENSDVAIHQLAFILSKEHQKIDAFISLGGWAQAYPSKFREAIDPLKEKIDQHQIQMIFPDTLDTQLELLEQGYSSVNIGQAPFEMGRQAVHVLFNIIHKLHFAKETFTPISICTRNTLENCSKFEH